MEEGRKEGRKEEGKEGRKSGGISFAWHPRDKLGESVDGDPPEVHPGMLTGSRTRQTKGGHPVSGIYWREIYVTSLGAPWLKQEPQKLTGSGCPAGGKVPWIY